MKPNKIKKKVPSQKPNYINEIWAICKAGIYFHENYTKIVKDKIKGDKMTLSLKRQLKEIARSKGITVTFYRNMSYGGLAYPWLDKIKVCTTNIQGELQTDECIIMTFFHEMGHIVDYRRNRYKAYNRGVYSYNYAIKFALKAEQSADMTGKRMCKKYFPHIKWKASYIDKYDIEFLKKYIDGVF